MVKRPLTIWCNAAFPEPVMEQLTRGLGDHPLLLPPLLQASNLAVGEADPMLGSAQIAFGQPDPQQVIDLPALKWVHLTTAGYTRYDTAAVRQAMAARGGQLTSSSQVYEEPCAEHLLAFMLANGRQLHVMAREQSVRDSDFRSWRQAHHRGRSQLLIGQSAMIFGFGTIARRLAELLTPFKMNLIGVRRKIAGDEKIPMATTEQASAHLPHTDHVFNILPAAASTAGYFNAERFQRMKQGAVFYNIGRGNTVDQAALIAALKSDRLSAAYLDVTDPEPLPKTHPLWDAPNCWITAHTAGGHTTEFPRLVDHFLANLQRFEAGQELIDRVI